MRRPNVLLIMTDQHRADHVGFGGNRVVATPHLDAIAARGMQFDRAYVANPVCMPNRSSIITGVMPSVHGTYANGVALDPRRNTFVRRLREAGWRTGLVGKSHLQNMGHRNKDHVPVGDDGLDAIRFDQPEGWDEHELIGRFDDPSPAGVSRPSFESTDFYGFESVAFASDHGDLVGGHYRQWLREKGVDWRDHQDLTRHGLYNLTSDPTYKPSLPPELYPTTFVAERAVEFIDRATGADADARPWMLQCSFPDPHHPFTPPGEFFERYRPADMELPPTWSDPHEKSVPFIKRKFETKGTPGGFFAWAPSEDQLRRAMAAQYGSIDMIDEAVGRIIATLERSGQLDDTLIIFTSDHGELMGDHGLILKMFVHYTGILRVPLVVSGPGVPAGSRSSLVSSLDIAPTILDLVGVTPHVGIQGRSLTPTFDDQDVVLHEQLLVEDDYKAGRDLFKIGRRNRMRTLVTTTDRYTRYIGTDWTESFDLDGDPDELENRAGSDSVNELELRGRLIDAMADHDDVSRRPTHNA